MYAPLSTNRSGPGRSVGIIGIGGLGDLGSLFAKALGADKVIAISRTSGNKSDALEFRAHDLTATQEEDNLVEKHGSSLNVVISIVSYPNVTFLSQ